MQQRAYNFGSKSYVITRVFLEHERKTLKIQTRSCKDTIQYCAEALFSGTHCRESKIENKSRRTGNSSQLIKSEKCGEPIGNSWSSKIVYVERTHSFLHGVCILRPSVSKSVKRYTNLHFSLKGHVYYMYVFYVCVCLQN